MPENVNILTLEPWDDGENVLVRVEHFLEANDDPELSKPASLPLRVYLNFLRVCDAMIKLIYFRRDLFKELTLRSTYLKPPWAATKFWAKIRVLSSKWRERNLSSFLAPMRPRLLTASPSIPCKFAHSSYEQAALLLLSVQTRSLLSRSLLFQCGKSLLRV